MRPGVNSLAAIGIVVLLASASALPDFSGEWEFVSSTGTTPPPGFHIQANQSSTALRVRSQWTEPQKGQYGLTLVGLLTPELTFSLDGREDVNQSGPFLIHSKTRWNGTHLVTTWSTSEHTGASFKGEWIRSVSSDGRELTLEIQADSSQGRHSNAILKFRKR